MQTLVVHAAPSRRPASERDAARARVESHYDGLWAAPPVFREARTETVSVLLWDSARNPSSWPAWSPGGGTTVASTYVPLGFEQLVGTAPLEQAPRLLAQALVAAPSRILELGAPFVLATVDDDQDTLDLFTDALGIGRVFEVPAGDGWVWSNRPVAALRYAGKEAARDELAWCQSAVADVFFGAATPYAGVSVLDGATRVRWDGRASRRTVGTVDVVASWSRPSPGSAVDRDHLRETAESLRAMAASVARLYPGQAAVNLSGGRDSRLVASSFVAAGVDVVLHSHDAVPGDLVTARELVGRLPTPLEHRVRHTQSGGTAPPRPCSAIESARRWHRYAEGLRPSSFLMHAAPSHLDASPQPVIGGVGGEIAHGSYYPPNLPAFDDLPLHERIEAFATTIAGRHAVVPGTSAAAVARVRGHVLEVLDGIAARGITDGRMLDYYYLRERMRRWGTAGESVGVLSPLLSPAFMRAALSLTPDDRQRHRLQRGLTRELVPEWADVPYFPSEAGAGPLSPARSAPAPRILRLADCVDTGEITGVLADPSSWSRGFEVPHVHALWHLSAGGRTTARQELVLRRVVWSGAFEDHLARVNGTPPPERRAAEVPAGHTRTSGPGRLTRRARLVSRLRAQPTVRSVVRREPFHSLWHSPVGRRIRQRVLAP